MTANIQLLTFIDDLIKQKFPSISLTEESLEEMRQEMLLRFNQMLYLEFATYLTPEQFDQFESLSEKNAEESEIQNFFAQAIPDQAPIITITLQKFREIYLGPQSV